MRARGMDVYKSWALCASFESIAKLACVCTHPLGSHTCIAGARLGDKYLSELTAEYPPSLAASMADTVAPFVSSQGWRNASIADFANLLPETYVAGRMKLCDGAGVQSSADRIFPQRSKLKSLANKWWQALQDASATASAMLHLSEAKPCHPFSVELQERMAAIAAEELLPASTCEHATHISPGQPYRLRILQAPATHCQDPDTGLVAMLEEGVPTGISSEIPTSHQWPPAKTTSNFGNALAASST